VTAYLEITREHVKRLALQGYPAQMVLIIVPNDNKTRYDALKTELCLQLPVPSQVVQWKTLSNEKNYTSVIQKVLLQMNCKIGGSIWKVNIPVSLSFSSPFE
jgi:aubergine-like protein